MSGGDIREKPFCVHHDKQRHGEVWRLAAYATANCLVAMELSQLRLYGLRPVDLLIFNVVALASVQKTVRDVRALDLATHDISPDDFLNGTISRRRIADVTGVPRTTVARALVRLIAREMVVERGRGQLQVPVGVALQGRFNANIEQLYAPVIQLFDQLMRMGVVRIQSAAVEQ